MDTAIHGGNLAVSGSMQERHGATGRTRQAAFAAVGFVSLLLAVLLGWLSLQGEGGCSGDNDAAALRHERETLLARQLERYEGRTMTDKDAANMTKVLMTVAERAAAMLPGDNGLGEKNSPPMVEIGAERDADEGSEVILGGTANA